MKVLILAGGFATRLWPLTEKRAKPLLLLNGKTILAHILEKIPESFEIFILTNKRFEADFHQEVKKLTRKNTQVFCEDAFSDGEKIGALGSISAFVKSENIKENILVFAGDNLLPNLKVEQLFPEEDTAKLAVREVESLHEARKFGVVEIETKPVQSKTCFRVKNFVEKPENPPSKLVATGFLGIGRELLPILHNFAQKSPDALGSIFTEFLHHQKTVLAEMISGSWFDVGSFETYLAAHRNLQRKPIHFGKNIKQSSNRFSGKVFIGNGCTIKNCRITDSIIYPGTRLENCHISNTVIDESCTFTGLDLNQKLIRRKTQLEN